MSPQAPFRLTRVVIIGTGRMGRALLEAAPGFPALVVSGAVASAASPALGRDAGEAAGVGVRSVRVTSDLPGALAAADVALDFSSPSATRANLEACRAARKPLLIGTTGFGPELETALEAASSDIALLVAANTSLGVALLTELVRLSARTLPAAFDIDVLDLHHRGKRDAPSGTALALASAAAQARGLPPAAASPAVPGAARPQGRIGMASVRAGDLVGEHQVLFTASGEQLALSYRANDRGVFARGALQAALWLTSRPPGRYSVQDMVFGKTST